MTRKRARTESEEVLKREPEEETEKTHSVSQVPNHANPSELEGHEIQPGRDAEFWFGDGTVILVAKDIEFRIYRGLLADYSPVFKAIFAAQASVSHGAGGRTPIRRLSRRSARGLAARFAPHSTGICIKEADTASS